MVSKQIKIREEILEKIKHNPGSSWSQKIENCLNKKTDIDYDKIEKIVNNSIQNALTELKEGRL